MPIRVITFDLDNTLWDVEEPLRRAEEAQRHWLAEHRPETSEHLDSGILAEIRHELLTNHPELKHNLSQLRTRFLERLILRAGYSKAEASTGAKVAFATFLEARQQVELYPGVVQTLKQLAEHYTLGALTNGNADVYKTPAGEFMSFAFLAEHVGASKPHSALFDAAASETGAAPGEILHVGDNPDHDIGGARAAGFMTAWVNSSDNAWSGDGPPSLTIRHVAELPAALETLQLL